MARKAKVAKPNTAYSYKVLLNGASIHGGSLKWELPNLENGSWVAGKWHKVDGELSICSWGLHLTDEPARWFTSSDCKVYLAEYEIPQDMQREEDKICVAKCRLVKELNIDELAGKNIFLSGVHTVTDSYAIAYDSSTVEAYGSSTVKAYNNSTVKACDSSTVIKWGSGKVTLEQRAVLVDRSCEKPVIAIAPADKE